MPTDKIIKSIPIAEARALLSSIESERGYVQMQCVSAKAGTENVGWTPLPDHQNAYLVETHGVDGYLFSNPQDDYLRYDFIPRSAAILHGDPIRATPEADRQAAIRAAKDARDKLRLAAINEQNRREELWRAKQLVSAKKLLGILQFTYGDAVPLPSDDNELIGSSAMLGRVVAAISEYRGATQDNPSVSIPKGKSLREMASELIAQLQTANTAIAHGFRPAVTMNGEQLCVDFHCPRSGDALSRWVVALDGNTEVTAPNQEGDPIRIPVWFADPEIAGLGADSIEYGVSVTERGRRVAPCASEFSQVMEAFLEENAFFAGNLSVDVHDVKWDEWNVLDQKALSSTSALLFAMKPCQMLANRFSRESAEKTSHMREYNAYSEFSA